MRRVRFGARSGLPSISSRWTVFDPTSRTPRRTMRSLPAPRRILSVCGTAGARLFQSVRRGSSANNPDGCPASAQRGHKIQRGHKTRRTCEHAGHPFLGYPFPGHAKDAGGAPPLRGESGAHPALSVQIEHARLLGGLLRRGLTVVVFFAVVDFAAVLRVVVFLAA